MAMAPIFWISLSRCGARVKVMVNGWIWQKVGRAVGENENLERVW